MAQAQLVISFALFFGIIALIQYSYAREGIDPSSHAVPQQPISFGGFPLGRRISELKQKNYNIDGEAFVHPSFISDRLDRDFRIRRDDDDLGFIRRCKSLSRSIASNALDLDDDEVFEGIKRCGIKMCRMPGCGIPLVKHSEDDLFIGPMVGGGGRGGSRYADDDLFIGPMVGGGGRGGSKYADDDLLIGPMVGGGGRGGSRYADDDLFIGIGPNRDFDDDEIEYEFLPDDDEFIGGIVDGGRYIRGSSYADDDQFIGIGVGPNRQDMHDDDQFIGIGIGPNRQDMHDDDEFIGGQVGSGRGKRFDDDEIEYEFLPDDDEFIGGRSGPFTD